MTTLRYDELRGGYDDAAQTAINQSAIHNEIVTLIANSEFHRDNLVSALESLDDETDKAENGDVTEVWSVTGDQWRVHVKLA